MILSGGSFEERLGLREQISHEYDEWSYEENWGGSFVPFLCEDIARKMPSFKQKDS